MSIQKDAQERISQEKLIRVWQKSTRCEVLIGEECYSFATDFNKNSLIIFKKSENLLIRPGETVCVKIILNAIYVFKTKVRSIKEGIITYYRLDIPKTAIRIQRRNSFRLNIEFPVKYKQGNKIKNALVKDISASGLKMLHEDLIRPGTEVKIKLALRGNTLTLKGIVRHSLRIEKGFLSGLEFINIEEAEKEMVTRFIFEAERNRKVKKALNNG